MVTNTKLVIMLGTHFCPRCIHDKVIFFSLEGMYYDHDFEFVDVENNPDMHTIYDIQEYPTYVVWDDVTQNILKLENLPQLLEYLEYYKYYDEDTETGNIEKEENSFEFSEEIFDINSVDESILEQIEKNLKNK